jgi:7-cyano-7-deazaguanine tRNA-ribosyltransferase
MSFEIKDRDAGGRICKFSLNHGIITTPTLLPVINPKKMIISPKEMKQLFKTEIVMTNSYIIHQDKKLRDHALAKGVHDLIDFDGPIMTDSGTFQSYVYGKIKIDPQEIINFQKNIGSDIGTILDVFTTPNQSKKTSEKAVQTTLQRAKQAVSSKDSMYLACPVQGSLFMSLREKCARELSKLPADVYPIGGVVPLMENQCYTDLVRCILSSKRGLDPSKPVHLFGAGHPLIFPLAVALGCDLFDSSSYAKYAVNDRMIFPWGTEKIENLNELPCPCPICTKYTASELQKTIPQERYRALAVHNLFVCFSEIRNIRQVISRGALWELVEHRAQVNPYLYDALQELKKLSNTKWLEQFERTSKSAALSYSGSYTIYQPLVYRILHRLQTRYTFLYKNTVLLPEIEKPYAKHYYEQLKPFLNHLAVNFIIQTPFGPIPLELDEMYPFAQSVFPANFDNETKLQAEQMVKKILGKKSFLNFQEVQKLEKNDNVPHFDLRKITAVTDMQFGKNASQALLSGKINIVKSKKTGKIRNIYCDDLHILSMRASDGLFTLKMDGACLLHQFFSAPQLRVVILDDAVTFVKQGKSVFAKFVAACDPELRPFDECLVVDRHDNLLAVGRCLLNREEMVAFSQGVAVKIRETNTEIF